MIRKTDLLALHFDEVNQASIGDVVMWRYEDKNS